MGDELNTMPEGRKFNAYIHEWLTHLTVSSEGFRACADPLIPGSYSGKLAL